MKKITLVLALISLTLGTKAQTKQQPPAKKYAVTATLEEWQEVFAVLGQSHSPYPDVIKVQNLLAPQLQAQLQAEQAKPKYDTLKVKSDTTNTNKKK